MAIDTAQIKRLRQLTSVGVMECKRALEETGGDFEKAQALLAERAAQKAKEKSNRKSNTDSSMPISTVTDVLVCLWRSFARPTSSPEVGRS